MAGRGRSIRSNAVPAGGRRQRAAAPSTRPELRVVDGTRMAKRESGGFARLITWTRSRGSSLVHIAAAAVFLTGTLIGALLLRTQMIENAFEASAIEDHIAMLTQDVQEDQARLDALIASLPAKAEEMGMTTQQGSVSIDLSDYDNGKDGAQ